jgi:hypothetical protein
MGGVCSTNEVEKEFIQVENRRKGNTKTVETYGGWI